MNTTTPTPTENIAICQYYCGFKYTEYEAMRMEAGFAYAIDFGSDDLALSETFWKWFDNQYSICTSTFAQLLKRESVLPTEDILRKIFVRHHSISATDLYPQAKIHNEIMNEIFRCINATEIN